jgi:hypothetical protein
MLLNPAAITHGLCIIDLNVSVPSFGMASRAVMARLTMAAANKVMAEHDSFAGPEAVTSRR